jgi:hypothetical protein
MIQLFIVSALIGLLAALVGIFIAMKIQFRSLTRLQMQQEAWQRAQEAHQRTWEVRQGSHALDVEKKLSRQIQQVEETWQTWEVRDQERIAAMTQEFQMLMGKLNLEHELAKLPHTDETPLLSNDHGQSQQPFKNWRPPTFCGADLSGRDLSNRYLVRVDFREARLAGTNFYMADLRGACLAGADLTDADLSGADLSGADLRSTILKGANLLVADMHNAVLNGANLRGIRNLTADQAYSAIFDNATQFDADFDVTLPRIRSIRFTVYTESTPLVSLQSSQIVKQLEAPRNTVEAMPTITPPEATEKQPAVSESPSEAIEKQPAVSESLADSADTVPPASAIAIRTPETADEPQPDTEDIISTEAISNAALPDATGEPLPDSEETIPHQAITLAELPGASEQPPPEELEMVPPQSLPPTDLSDTPEESLTEESEMVVPESLPPTDLQDVPTRPLQDTAEADSVKSAEPGELIEQPEITEDADGAVTEVTDFANGESANHINNGSSTNGTSSIVPDLTSLMEQPIEDTPLMPPPSNGNSHTPTETQPRPDKQGNRHTGEAGKGTHRKGQSGRRRARTN